MREIIRKIACQRPTAEDFKLFNHTSRHAHNDDNCSFEISSIIDPSLSCSAFSDTLNKYLFSTLTRRAKQEIFVRKRAFNLSFGNEGPQLFFRHQDLSFKMHTRDDGRLYNNTIKILNNCPKRVPRSVRFDRNRFWFRHDLFCINFCITSSHCFFVFADCLSSCLHVFKEA